MLEHVADNPPLFWVRSLQVVNLDGRTLELDHLPGKKQVRRFFGDRQREQLGLIVQEIIQRPVSVRLVDVEAAEEFTQEQQAAAAPAARDRADRKQAMESPAIKQIVEMFDARLIKTYTVKSEESIDEDAQPGDGEEEGPQ